MGVTRKRKLLKISKQKRVGKDEKNMKLKLSKFVNMNSEKLERKHSKKETKQGGERKQDNVRRGEGTTQK